MTVQWRKRRRAPRYTPDEPLELEGAVPGFEPLPSRGGAVARAVAAGVRRLPTYSAGRAGREKALWIRLGLGAVALSLVALGREQWQWGLVGIAVATLLVVVPTLDTRQRRWLDALRRLEQPRQRAVSRPASLRFDGRKISIRAADRVWRSLRPANPPHEVVVAYDESGWAWLGLVPPSQRGARRPEPLWFRAPADRLADRPEPTPRAEPGGEAMTLEAEGWATLRAAVAAREA